MKNVMVFSCGSILGIDINFALRGNSEYKVYGASSYDDHGLYVYENYIGNVPFIYEPDFIPRFNEILRQYKIDFIIPCHEDMILFFQQHINEIDAVVVSSCLDTAILCRYKSKTYNALKEYSFVPNTYKIDEVREFPVFVKKDDDQGARHAYKVENYDDLKLYAHQDKMIICEYLPGEEVTVDCFTDRHGELRFVNPRVADRMLAGIDVHSRRVIKNTEIYDIARKINSRVSFRGPWFFQIKRSKTGEYKLLEIASRFAGAFALTLGMDINTPLMALRDFDNKDVIFSYNDTLIEADKTFITRYKLQNDYESVLLDGIEPLFLNGKINPTMMMFIYQVKNECKEICILTDDASTDIKTLAAYKVDSGIFRFIPVDSKSIAQNTVFISINEEHRIDMREEYRLSAYAPSMIGVLLNWRA